MEEGLEITVITERTAGACGVAGVLAFGAVIGTADPVEVRRVLHARIGARIHGKLPVNIGSVLTWDGIGNP